MKILADSYTIPSNLITATGATRELLLANAQANGVITVGGTNYAFLTSGNFDYKTIDPSTLTIGTQTPIVNSYRESDFAAGVALPNYGGGSYGAIAKYSTTSNLFNGTFTSQAAALGMPSYSSNGIFLSTSSTDSSWRGFSVYTNGYLSYINSASPSVTWTNNTSTGSPYYVFTTNYSTPYQVALFGRGQYGYCVAFNGGVLMQTRIASGTSFAWLGANSSYSGYTLGTDPSGTSINVENIQSNSTPKYLWEIGGNVFYMVKVYSTTYPTSGNHRRIFMFNGDMANGTLGVAGFLGGTLNASTVADWVFDGSFLPMPVQGGMLVKTSSGVFKVINSGGGATNYTSAIPTSSFPVSGSNWATSNASKPARAFTPPSTISSPTNASLTANGDKFLGSDGYVYTLTDNPYLTTLNQVGTDEDWMEKALSIANGTRVDYSAVTLADSQAIWVISTQDAYLNIFGYVE